jgi:uncharacterized protein YjbJ (UPF0337 family)
VNKDQAKGAAYKLIGMMQETTGRVIGSKDLQIKGIQKQVMGNADTALGNAKRDVMRLKALDHWSTGYLRAKPKATVRSENLSHARSL